MLPVFGTIAKEILCPRMKRIPDVSTQSEVGCRDRRRPHQSLKGDGVSIDKEMTRILNTKRDLHFVAQPKKGIASVFNFCIVYSSSLGAGYGGIS